MRILVGLVLLLVIVFGPAACAKAATLDELATMIAGTPVTVSCDLPENGDAAGEVVFVNGSPEHVIHLIAWECASLARAGDRRYVRSFEGGLDLGESIENLTHEATHIALASTDEGLVECTAYRNTWHSLHLLPLTSRAVRQIWWAAGYRHYSFPTTGVNAIYRSVC